MYSYIRRPASPLIVTASPLLRADRQALGHEVLSRARPGGREMQRLELKNKDENDKFVMRRVAGLF